MIQLERMPEVEDSVAVGLRVDGDVQVVLFVKLAKPDHNDGGRPPSKEVREEERKRRPNHFSRVWDGKMLGVLLRGEGAGTTQSPFCYSAFCWKVYVAVSAAPLPCPAAQNSENNRDVALSVVVAFGAFFGPDSRPPALLSPSSEDCGE